MSEVKIDLRAELGKFLKKEEADTLTTLVMMQLESGNHDGEFDCSESNLASRLPFSRKTNNKWIKRLREMGYVTTSIRGFPLTKRVVTIQYQFMLETILAFKHHQESIILTGWHRSGVQANTTKTTGWHRSGAILQYKVLNTYNTIVFVLHDLMTEMEKVKTNITQHETKQTNNVENFPPGGKAPLRSASRTDKGHPDHTPDHTTQEMDKLTMPKTVQPSLCSGDGFFKGMNKDNKLTHFDLVMATRLFAQVKRHRPGLRWKKSKWAHEIRVLRNEVEQDTDRIENTIEGLSQSNLRPTSAIWFRKNFSWVEERVTKTNLPSKTAITQPVQTEEVLTFISNYNWPESVTPDQVESIVVSSLGNYESFYKAFMKLYKEREAHPKLKMEIAHLSRKLSQPVDFVCRWLTQTCELVHKWKNWSGSLKGLEFHPLNKKFTTMAVEWTKEYSGRERDWFSILDLMGYKR